MRFFNTAGPIQRDRHYHVPPLERLDADDVRLLIRQWKYFVLHAPRQTGKTSALLELRDELNAAGEVRCVYVNVEVGQTAREDVAAGMRAILSTLASAARHALDDGWLGATWPGILERAGPHDALRETLSRWAESNPKPIVLLIDEIDALVGDTLLAVLRQLRAGYPERPRLFPQSVVLCGVRDVRDYRIRSGSENAIVAGGSAFNIRAKSLRLGDFSSAEVDSLLAQHTAETGQAFTAAAREAIWDLTQGQPWLVNALAYETCFDSGTGRDRSRPIAAAAVRNARERLIARRETHLDQLTDKLQEERVRRVVEPLLSGAPNIEAVPADDIEYVRDLGLVRSDEPIAIANPIYREVIPRELTFSTQATLAEDPAWYVGDNGVLQVDKLLAAFQAFFREHSEHWVERFQYREAGPQLLLQAFLQRIVNSGGRIEREYGLGRMRTDLLIVWPMEGDSRAAQRVVIECKVLRRSLDETLNSGGRIEREYGLGRMRTDLLIVWPMEGDSRAAQRVVIECKVLRRSLDETLREGLRQTRAYMDRCAAAEGHLVMFDRTEGKAWDEKVYRRDEVGNGVPVTIWGV